jgi:hypothetical protein
MNQWINYISRSYSQIKASVNRSMDTVTPEITDRTNSNMLMVIVDIFAGVAEMINYYIDTTAREIFLPTARRFSSILKIAAQANYHGKARTSASALLTFTAKNESDETITATTPFTIPKGTLLNDERGYQWVTQVAQTIRAGYSSVQIDARQISLSLSTTLGTSNGQVNQEFVLPITYHHNSISIQIDGVIWELKETLGASLPTHKHFIVTMASDGLNYIRFGDGNNGAIPGSGLSISASFETTEGADGNADQGTINTITSILNPTGIDHFSVTNLDVARGGREREGIEQVRRAIPLSLRTLTRAVTLQDYEDIATLHVDIRKARATFSCTKGAEIFLVAHGGGNVSNTILSNVKQDLENKGMMSIPIQTYPSGETEIRGVVNIKGRYRVPLELIQSNVKQALIDLYNPYISDINQDVRKSDIISKVDQVDQVDYLSLESIYAQPYLRPSNLNYLLPYNITLLSGSVVNESWELLYDPLTDPIEPFCLFKSGIFQAKLAPNTSITGVASILDISIGALPGNIQQGDFWKFTTYPYNQDIELDDLSIPIIKPESFTLNIEQAFI